MRKTSLLLILVALSIVIITPAFAATYTVKTSGGNFTSIQACADAAQAGDTCLVSSGTYSGVTIPRSGTAGNRITFLADSAGSKPVVTGDFNFGNKSYITVNGFYMDGGSFRGADCSFIEILNNTIEKSGLGIASIKPGYNILISDNTFIGLTNDIIRQFGSRWVIRNNVATNMVDVNDEHFDFWQTYCDSGSNFFPADYALVENNTFANIAGPNVHFFLFHATTLCGSDQGTNYIIRYNKINNIGSNGVTLDNDSGAPGFDGMAIYNNTFVKLNEGDPPSWLDYIGALDDTTNAFFKNNLLYDAADPSGTEGIYPTSVPADNSLVYDPGSSVTTDGALRNASGTIINQDPLLTNINQNDFSLNPDSPAIDAGGPLTTVASGDSGSGTSLRVESAWSFQDGWAGVPPDTLLVGDKVAQISSINYGTDTITLSSSISRSAGDPVYLYNRSDGSVVVVNSSPDIGASEYNSNVNTGTPTIPRDFQYAN